MGNLKTRFLVLREANSHMLALLAMAGLSIAGLSSCTQTPAETSGSASPQPQATQAQESTTTDLQIVTSTLPITGFTKAVVGDRAEVTYLLPTNVGPHDYQAKPEDVRTLAEADVLVKNGLGIDEYLDSLVDNANNASLQVIDTSEGVETISNAAVEGEHQEEAAETEAGGHDHAGEFNPHIWLDPARAIEQVETIRDGLIAADPEGKETYTSNAAAYIDKLEALDQEIATTLQPYADKAFVTYHDFAPYFAQRYELKAEFLVGVPAENPSPMDVQRVIDAAKASDLKTLLTEPQAAGNPFEALSADLNVQVSSFDPMETSGAEGVEPDYYITIMRQNAKNLQAAFGAAQSRSLSDPPDSFIAFMPPVLSDSSLILYSTR
jgi:zinc transport system substrate-binding protein